MSASVPLILEEDCERGGKEDFSIEDDFAYRNNVHNATKSIRLAFIRKVYGLLSMQLLLTLIIGSVFIFTPPIKEFVQTNNWMLIVSFIGSIVLLIALHIKRKESPANLILLAAFTVVQAYTVGVLITFYSKEIVIEALLLTFIVLAGLTAFTFQTERDFSATYSGLFAGLCILLVGGLLQAVFQSTVFELALALGGTLFFCLFIIYDTQLILKTVSPEEYILATVNLYMDIINLFIYILRLLQAVNRQ